MQRLDTALAEHPTLALAGNGYVGAGIPDTVRSANEAARRLSAALAVKRAAECRA
jgi:protoporphyrinogen oxidase